MLTDCINAVHIRGNVGSIRIGTPNGKRVSNFSVATNYVYKDASGNAMIETTWHNCVLWHKNDDTREIKSGCAVEVWGRLRSNRYTDANGVERSVMEIVVDKCELL